MTNQLVDFRNFVNEPKKIYSNTKKYGYSHVCFPETFLLSKKFYWDIHDDYDAKGYLSV